MKQVDGAALLFAAIFAAHAAPMLPPPFTRELYLSDPLMTGKDVFLLQSLLQRDTVQCVFDCR